MNINVCTAAGSLGPGGIVLVAGSARSVTNRSRRVTTAPVLSGPLALFIRLYKTFV
jgi:hypothetical protein